MEIENSPGKTDPPAPAESSSSMQESSGGEGVGREVLLNREIAVSQITRELTKGDHIALVWISFVRWREWKFYTWITKNHQEFMDGTLNLEEMVATDKEESYGWTRARIKNLPIECGCPLELWVDQKKPEYTRHDLLPDDNVLLDYGHGLGWHRIADVYRLQELTDDDLDELLEVRCAYGFRGLWLMPETLPKRYPTKEELWENVAKSKALIVPVFDQCGFLFAVRS